MDEVCDGLDQDCDGRAEEEVDDLGEPCAVGVGRCATEGVTVCHGAGGVVCDAVAGEPGVEICNAADDDCDGAVDEALAGLGEACTVGVGQCAAVGIGVCGDAGDVVCAAIAGEPGVERCDDEVDDDCDGATDEGFADLGAPCAAGRGACAAVGRRICAPDGDAVVCSAQPGEPMPETCDGVDEDCDGATDEHLLALCYPGPDGTEGVGACRAGASACVEGAEGACEGAVVPAAETCNGVDDDCDGSTDEGLGLGEPCTVGHGVCSSDGVRVCARGAAACDAPVIEPQLEVCNGVDDDCDGAADEADPALGDACDTGELGICAAGARACADGQLVCTRVAEPSPEVCDGLDNDCDGRVDADEDGDALAEPCYEGPEGTEGVGRCHAGVRTCEAGRFGDCADQTLPAAERCDAQDDDCNGLVDDVADGACVCAPGEQRPCYTGPEGTQNIGSCVGGTETCAADGRSFGLCAGEVVPAAEVCNDADDDCDGEVDDVPGVGDPCAAGEGACRAEGQLQCDVLGELLVCDAAPGAPTDEICDAVDNDCDAAVDELPDLGEPCAVGLGACRREGTRTCDLGTGATTCSATAGAPAPTDICAGGQDEDCDGRADEGDDCHANAACAGPVEWNCACEPGYAGDGFECAPTCALEPCVHGVCDDGPAGFMCDCGATGYEGDTCSEDVDECARGLHDCVEGTVCENTLGGFECPCAEGAVVIDGECVECESNRRFRTSALRHEVIRREDFISALAPLDVDGDGHQDLITANTSEEVAWYRGDGAGGFGDRVVVGGSPSRPMDIATGDIDGDGVTDIAILGGTGQLAWYRSNGDGTLGAKQVVGRHGGQSQTLELSDLDGDGDLDLLATALEAPRLAWYRNDGDGAFELAQRIDDVASVVKGAVAVDVDGDGDLDVISASRGEAQIAWYPNAGGGSFGAPIAIVDDWFSGEGAYAADFDGDGDLDVVAAGSGNALRLHWNDGDAGFEAAHVLMGHEGIGPLGAGDFDGDGLLDVFAAAHVPVWFRNHGDGTFGEAKILGRRGSGRVAYALDVDGDGDVDFLAMTPGPDIWYENPGDGDFEGSRHVIARAAEVRSAQAADLDGDGDLDVVYGSTSYDEILWSENLGVGRFGPPSRISDQADGPHAVRIGDVDGDGDADVVAASYDDDELAWYQNDGEGGFGPQRLITRGPPNGAYSIALADLDDDGDLDVVSASTLDDTIAWYANLDGRGAFGGEQVISRSTDGPVAVRVADVDGDGDLDVLSASYIDSKLAWYPNEGEGRFGAQRIINQYWNANAQSLDAGDLDGDGDLDVVAVSYLDFEIAWYPNEGGGAFGPQRLISVLEHDRPVCVSLGDLDGDGDLDVVASSLEDGRVSWYPNAGDGTFGAQELITELQDDAREVSVADIDGDGDLDVLSASWESIAWHENELSCRP